ncbi:VC0807 family protein [Vibrio genomosp. F10]|uniref:MFS transporter n=2 Tax=Vibrio genomosp. F10 TaxID=723171 RepID=A0A1B9QW32_9VIBR|nr:VC0807 family protein [Vibrio genomosp. F10]OCH73565.1 MFS transporter [Vibrio genomosp. F10]OEE32074.1 MFS transporter [Vibrio genomosp. F10 str. ZF-129]OEE93368.1 MFS transporter [Vibrio genomosp. F10 str. 9ZC157]OEF00585.1 MFS transporter [Vibrio genomosp. F10 str. 9ZD137]OEF06403.1 MFS transporter [Vibrio genomosp. F10 str. 9ZB36]
MSNTASKKSNPLFEIVFNVFLPSFILMKFSGDEHLGTVMALVVALAFPVAYGGMDLIRNKKFNFIAALGFISVLLTGGIGLLELDTRWLALKEALIPGLIGLTVLGSTFTRYPIVKKVILNDTVLNLSLIKERLKQTGNEAAFERCLVISNYLFASTFAFSSAMNYFLATWIVTSPSGTAAFNEELGKLTLYSYPAIAVPSMLMMFGIFYYLWRQIRSMTSLDTDQIFHSS